MVTFFYFILYLLYLIFLLWYFIFESNIYLWKASWIFYEWLQYYKIKLIQEGTYRFSKLDFKMIPKDHCITYDLNIKSSSYLIGQRILIVLPAHAWLVLSELYTKSFTRFKPHNNLFYIFLAASNEWISPFELETCSSAWLCGRILKVMG